jgi:UDP-N-acetylglucosamine/UDP-N-acetylgalactosamine diphosphorylase
MASEKDRLFSLASRYGQEHIFQWWDELSEKGRESLLSQAAMIDFGLVARLMKKGRSAGAPVDLEPAPIIRVPRSATDLSRAQRAKKIGEEALASGKAAALLVAGGQATRLRFEHAKGLYPIGPVSGKHLFQIHAEKILALSRRYKVRIPLYIMTSEATHETTSAFFEAHGRFGLQHEDLFLFKQGMMPAVDRQGRIILEAKGRIALSPNGHGGCIPALKRSGALDDMRWRGVEKVFFFHVDNPLVKILDPMFMGYHLEARAEMSGKVVPKRDPEERVGVVGKVGARYRVVEYVHLSQEDMHARNPDGALKYSAGVIGTYLLNVDFIARLNAAPRNLPYHRSEKTIPCLGPNGETLTPKGKNGIKLEMFVFDALPLAKRCVMMEVKREEEFAPVKNKEGEDSPATALAMMCDLFGGWLRRLGVRLKTDELGRVAMPVEISPLFAMDEDELRGKIKGLKIDGERPVYLGGKGERAK